MSIPNTFRPLCWGAGLPPGWAIVESVYKPESLSVEVPVQFEPGMSAEFDIGNISHSFADFIILGATAAGGLSRVYLLSGWGGYVYNSIGGYYTPGTLFASRNVITSTITDSSIYIRVNGTERQLNAQPVPNVNKNMQLSVPLFPAAFRVFSMKMYVDGVLVCTFTPVGNIEKNKYGLYDEVSKKLLTTQCQA